MSLEIDRDAVDVATVPRDRDGATLHAVMRPDVDTVPTEEELEEALSR